MNMKPNGCPIGRLVAGALIVLGFVLSFYAAFLFRPTASGRSVSHLAQSTRQPSGAICRPGDLNQDKVRLGKLLFNDVRLSGDGTRSCASCHDLASNGALDGKRETSLDTPTVFNVVLNYRFGWTGSFTSLEAQALATIESPLMARGASPQVAYRRIAADRALSHAFDRVYGQAPSRETIADALAEFERSLVTPSRFDRWLECDEDALTEREQRGYHAFVRLGCQSCHQGRGLGGNLMQRHGIFRPLASPQPAIVRVPGLRNVAETAPYFHDGSAATLEEAIRKMASSQLNRDLSSAEIRLLAEFLASLTGTYEGERVHR